MRFRLRTLLIALAIVPPAIALAWWYGKAAVGLLVLALLVCPDVFVFAVQGIWWIVAMTGSKIRDIDSKV
jgi:hypothetical protein